MNRLTLLIAVFAAALGLAPAARAGDVAVTAAVESTRVYIGDAVTFQITVDGAQSATPPDLSSIPGLTAQYAGARDSSSHSVTINNGRMQQQDTLRYIMQWQITPLKKGPVTIPALAVVVGGQSYQTSPITLTAVEPAESPDFRLKLEAEKTTAYVGEPVKLRMTWFLGKRVAGNVQFTGSDGGKVFDINPGPDPRPGGRDDQRYPALAFLGGQTWGRIGTGDMDGAQVTTVTLDVIVTPRQSGEVQVGPFSVVFQEIVGQRQPGVFDFPFDNRAVTERRIVSSNPVTLDVKVLPDEGRPAGFNGLIGNYGIKAASPERQANVGDPVPLTVRITGPEPLDSVRPPDLGSLPAFDNFKASPEGWQAAGGGKSGERAFTTTIRPRTDKVTEIPPVELSFFDSSTGKYSTARSTPLPLKVAPTREVTTADAISTRPIPSGAGAPTAPVAAAKPLERGVGGIAANYEDEDALINQGVSVIDFAGHPLGAAVLAGPPALCLAVSIARGRRAAGSPASRRRAALARARRLLRRAADHEQTAAALRAYLGPALGIEAGAFTSTDARALLTAAGSTLGDRTERLLAECECARYAGETPGATARGAPAAQQCPTPIADLNAQARSLLSDLHRDLEVLS